MAANFALSASSQPALRRLAALGDLNDSEMHALRDATSARRTVAQYRMIQTEGEPITGPSIVLSGWAAAIWSFADGRRQIMGVALPGELIGMARQQRPLAPCSIYAVTDVILCPAPRPLAGREGTGLAEVYAVSEALEQHYQYAHIARLGRLSAQDRVSDWLLEMHDRMNAAGLAQGNAFPFPLTQEVMADALGLTGVHVNRTVQGLRREGLIDLRKGEVRLPKIERLRSMVHYQQPRVAETARP
jgi:CRP-like cAMP-binding protein